MGVCFTTITKCLSVLLTRSRQWNNVKKQLYILKYQHSSKSLCDHHPGISSIYVRLSEMFFYIAFNIIAAIPCGDRTPRDDARRTNEILVSMLTCTQIMCNFISTTKCLSLEYGTILIVVISVISETVAFQSNVKMYWLYKCSYLRA